MDTESSRSDSTLVLYNADSYLYCDFVARFHKLADGLNQQISADTRELTELNRERERLRAAATRFQEIAEIARPKEERLGIALALMLNRVEREDTKAVAHFDGSYQPPSPEKMLTFPVVDTDLRSYPLWKVIREIVRHTGEVQIVKLERISQDFAFHKRVRRQSIESALAVHKRDFRITKRGREKFVALK
jgi:DICT domain-containing protein